MCGIVGFTGNRQAAPILLDGLSKLEYRGYDSAGLAVRDGENLAQVVKAKGRLSNLIEKMCIRDRYGINCHGRLSHENTLSIVKKADFSVLMRENKRYAKAGVSTKFVEAMSLAVPSICTAVGGTDAFVSDGVDGFLIKDNSVYEILGKLELIVNMDSSEILQMKLNALNKAKHVFSEDQYFEVTKLFLKGKEFHGQE